MNEISRIQAGRAAIVALAQRTSFAEVSAQFGVPVWKLLEWALVDPPRARAGRSK